MLYEFLKTYGARKIYMQLSTTPDFGAGEDVHQPPCILQLGGKSAHLCRLALPCDGPLSDWQPELVATVQPSAGQPDNAIKILLKCETNFSTCIHMYSCFPLCKEKGIWDE